MIESLLPPHKHLTDLCGLLCCLLISHSAVCCLWDSSSQFLCKVITMVETTKICLSLVPQLFLYISKEKESSLLVNWSTAGVGFPVSLTPLLHWLLICGLALCVCFPCSLRHITERVSFEMRQTAKSSGLAFKISFWNFSYQYLRL